MNENIFNLPSHEQFQEFLNLFRAYADAPLNDYTNSPGNKTLLKGDTSNGFYGFVQPEEMGVIVGNPEGYEPYNGDNLALAIGLSSGTSMCPADPLMKFARNGKTLFVPLRGYRYSATWDSIYALGAVYGTSDEGVLPPAGRIGTDLSIDASDNSINCTTQIFLGDKTSGMDYADTVGAIGDTLVLKGWTNAENNTTVTIDSITNTKIIVSGATLVTESGGKSSRFYKSANAVTQNRTVQLLTPSGDTITCKVRLMRGAANSPTDSYNDADRDTTGAGNEWNALILPLHERAKLGNWNYTAYAKAADGSATQDWSIGLTDENLRTHYTFGSGSYKWCQEPLDTSTWRRVARGHYGASFLYGNVSWLADSGFCWLPVLEVVL